MTTTGMMYGGMRIYIHSMNAVCLFFFMLILFCRFSQISLTGIRRAPVKQLHTRQKDMNVWIFLWLEAYILYLAGWQILQVSCAKRFHLIFTKSDRTNTGLFVCLSVCFPLMLADSYRHFIYLNAAKDRIPSDCGGSPTPCLKQCVNDGTIICAIKLWMLKTLSNFQVMLLLT